MRRLVSMAGCLGLAVALAGCWPVPGFDANRTANNTGETTLLPENVAGLTVRWAAPGAGPVGDPVLSVAGVHAVRPPCTLATVDARTGAVRWSAGTTTLDPSLCGQFAEVTSGPSYVVGDSVYVGSEARSASAHACNGFTHGLDVDTGAVTSDVAGGALEAFRNTDTVTRQVAASDCRFDEASQQFVREGMLGTLGQPLADFHVAGGFPQATLGAHGELYTAGLGLASSQPTGTDEVVEGVRAYRADSAPVVACGAAGDQACPHWVVPTDAAVAGPPVVDFNDGRPETLYAGTSAGTVYGLESAGFVTWTFPVGVAVTDTPALGHLTGPNADALYVPTADGRIVVLDTFGEHQFDLVTGTASALTGQPAIGGQVVYAGAADGRVYAFPAGGCSAPTCEPLWSAATGSRITGGPVVSRGRVYVGTADGRLIAYGLP